MFCRRQRGNYREFYNAPYSFSSFSRIYPPSRPASQAGLLQWPLDSSLFPLKHTTNTASTMIFLILWWSSSLVPNMPGFSLLKAVVCIRAGNSGWGSWLVMQIPKSTPRGINFMDPGWGSGIYIFNRFPVYFWCRYLRNNTKKSQLMVKSRPLARGVTFNGGRPEGEEIWKERLVSKTSTGTGYFGNHACGRICIASYGWKGIYKVSSPFFFGLSLPDTWHSGKDSGMRSEDMHVGSIHLGAV